MSVFGFNFKALYHLDVDELWDIARLIKGENHYLPKNKEVLIRGAIIPFFREVSKASKDADKEQVMRSSLVKVTQILSIDCKNWDTESNTWFVRQIRRKWREAFRKRLENLDEDELQAILNRAHEDQKKRAQKTGIGLLPAGGVIAGEHSSYGIYLETRTGRGAISSAIGVTYPWAVYQWATTVLGYMLGPIGWALAGASEGVGGIVNFRQWLKRKDHKLAIVVIAIIIAIGDNPYEWFGFEDTAPFPEVSQTYRAMMETFHPDLLPKHLPDWVKQRFNEFLLKTQENYEQIGRYQPEETS